jgi:hypothetical protein
MLHQTAILFLFRNETNLTLQPWVKAWRRAFSPLYLLHALEYDSIIKMRLKPAKILSGEEDWFDENKHERTCDPRTQACP